MDKAFAPPKPAHKQLPNPLTVAEQWYRQMQLVHSVSAAYPNSGVAHAVVTDLVRAGFDPHTITVISPGRPSTSTLGGGTIRDTLNRHWASLVNRQPQHRLAQTLARLIAHPSSAATLGALVMGLIGSLTVVVLGHPRSVPTLAVIGALAGAFSSVVASALGCLDAPRLTPDFVGSAIGAVTVEVETFDESAAARAKALILRHSPVRVQWASRPASGPPIWTSSGSRPNHQPEPASGQPVWTGFPLLLKRWIGWWSEALSAARSQLGDRRGL